MEFELAPLLVCALLCFDTFCLGGLKILTPGCSGGKELELCS